MDWIEQETQEINKTSADFGAVFSGISIDEMNAKPDAKTWIMGGCLDHIIQSNRRYYEMFDAVAAGK